jgi:hypothetical protein
MFNDFTVETDSSIVPYYRNSAWNLGYSDGESTKFCSKDNNQQEILDRLNQKTTTLFVERPSLILPGHDDNGNQRIFDDNQYLHILMPKKEFKVLGINSTEFDPTLQY